MPDTDCEAQIPGELTLAWNHANESLFGAAEAARFQSKHTQPIQTGTQSAEPRPSPFE
jgi:hypothetical protein